MTSPYKALVRADQILRKVSFELSEILLDTKGTFKIEFSTLKEIQNYFDATGKRLLKEQLMHPFLTFFGVKTQKKRVVSYQRAACLFIQIKSLQGKKEEFITKKIRVC